MRRLLTILLAVAALATSARAADLTADVRRLIAGDKAISKATVGVQIVKLGATREQDQTLVAIEPDRPLIPASNLKIITTALAMDTLGADFKFQTRLVTNGKDLALVGDGDPTFGDSEFLSPRGWTILTVFERWAAELKRQGVTSVHDVRVDDSIFEELTFHPNWPTNQAHLEYVAQVAGLNFNANCLDVFATRESNGTARVRTEPATNYVELKNTLQVGGSHSLYLSRELGTNRIIVRGTINATNKAPFRVTVDDPAKFAATVLAETLTSQGITITGDVVRDRNVRGAADWRLVAVHETPLLEVLDRTNKESVNLYAESVGKRAAAKRSGQPGSWKLLGEAQAALMQTAGAPANDAQFDDGCGLSKQNAVAPAAFCATLQYMFHGPNRDAYVHTMAVGGVDGTLDHRYNDDAIRGRVFAKSGTVNGVSTLGGYLKTKAGNWYAFSILMNETRGNRDAQAVQDKIVRAVDAADAAD